MFHSSSSEWKVIFYLELLTLLFLEFCSHFEVFNQFFELFAVFNEFLRNFIRVNPLFSCQVLYAHGWIMVITGEQRAEGLSWLSTR